MTDASDKLDIFLRHRANLIDYAAPIVGCRARAEDVVQEAWLRFAAAVERERPEEERILQPVGYLYRIVRNLAVDLSRRLAAESYQPDGDALLDGLPAGTATPEQQALDRDELRAVADALAELPQRTRRAFDLHRFGNRTFAEIGRELGISQTRAHNLVQDAIAHCMARLSRGSCR